MAWKQLSKETVALLASILLQLFPILANQTTDILSKVAMVILFVIFITVLMYTPKKGRRK